MLVIVELPNERRSCSAHALIDKLKPRARAGAAPDDTCVDVLLLLLLPPPLLLLLPPPPPLLLPR